VARGGSRTSSPAWAAARVRPTRPRSSSPAPGTGGPSSYGMRLCRRRAAAPRRGCRAPGERAVFRRDRDRWIGLDGYHAGELLRPVQVRRHRHRARPRPASSSSRTPYDEGAPDSRRRRPGRLAALLGVGRRRVAVQGRRAGRRVTPGEEPPGRPRMKTQARNSRLGEHADPHPRPTSADRSGVDEALDEARW